MLLSAKSFSGSGSKLEDAFASIIMPCASWAHADKQPSRLKTGGIRTESYGSLAHSRTNTGPDALYCYRMEHGFIRVTRMQQITLHDITPELARRSGFPASSICSRPPNTVPAKMCT